VVVVPVLVRRLNGGPHVFIQRHLVSYSGAVPAGHDIPPVFRIHASHLLLHVLGPGERWGSQLVVVC
jgi:hypothetical protein